MLKSALSLMFAGSSAFARTGTEALLPMYYGFATKATKAVASTTKTISRTAKAASKTTKAAPSKTSKTAALKSAKAAPTKARKAEAKLKRPVNAYSLFVKENFKTYKQGDEKTPAVGSKMGAAWKSLTDTQKKAYQDRAMPALEAYKKQKAAQEVLRKANARPPSAYILFFQEMRPKILKENPSLKVTQVASLSGAKWRALTEAQKAAYKSGAAKTAAR